MQSTWPRNYDFPVTCSSTACSNLNICSFMSFLCLSGMVFYRILTISDMAMAMLVRSCVVLSMCTRDVRGGSLLSFHRSVYGQPTWQGSLLGTIPDFPCPPDELCRSCCVLTSSSWCSVSSSKKVFELIGSPNRRSKSRIV